MAFYWDKMDAWLEEDEEIFGHAGDPYHRVDVRESSRPVRVLLAGEPIAETKRGRFLFETNHQTRHYIPKEDVRMDLLEPSEFRTVCPYKGNAVYWHARIGGELHEDVVWSYPDPIVDCPQIKGLMSFFNERVDNIFVDGTAVPKVETRWSRK